MTSTKADLETLVCARDRVCEQMDLQKTTVSFVILFASSASSTSPTILSCAYTAALKLRSCIGQSFSMNSPSYGHGTGLVATWSSTRKPSCGVVVAR